MSLEIKGGILRKYRGDGAGVDIPDGVLAIDEYVFRGTNVHHVSIPGSVAVIGVYAFNSCKRLAGIEIPDSVSVIGDSAFSRCKNLLSAKVGGIIIQERAFMKCTDLRSVTLSNHVRVIGDEAFYGCQCLESIVIPDSVTQIGSGAFAGCGRLRTVIIGKGVRHIGEHAFAGCALTKLAIDPENPWFISNGEGFHGRPGIRDERESSFIIEDGVLKAYTGSGHIINIPPTADRIGVGAFYHNPRPTHVNIHSGVTSIGALAFCRCKNVLFINFTDSVTSIGRRAFAQCWHYRGISMPAHLRANWKEYFEQA